MSVICSWFVNHSKTTSNSLFKKLIFHMFLTVFPPFYDKRANLSSHSLLSCSFFKDWRDRFAIATLYKRAPWANRSHCSLQKIDRTIYSIPNKIYLTLKSARKEQRELLYLLFFKSISLFCSQKPTRHSLKNQRAKSQPWSSFFSPFHSRVEWFSTFLNFEDYARLSIRYIFRSSNPKNRQFRPRMHVASKAKFSF